MPWSRLCTTGGSRKSINNALRRPIESAQYVSIKYTGRLAQAGIEPPVGSAGDSYGNALAETINGLYKAEVIHRRGPRRSFEAVEFATLGWVDWFNHLRLLEPIGNIPPAEAEQRYYAMLDDVPVAANLSQSASGSPGAVQVAPCKRMKINALRPRLRGGGRAHSHSAKHKFKVRIAIYIFNILEMRVRNLKSSFEENLQIL